MLCMRIRFLTTSSVPVTFTFLSRKLAAGFLVVKPVERMSGGVIQNEVVAILGDGAGESAEPRAWFAALLIGTGQ